MSGYAGRGKAYRLGGIVFLRAIYHRLAAAKVRRGLTCGLARA
jgi:hypothetical protein